MRIIILIACLFMISCSSTKPKQLRSIDTATVPEVLHIRKRVEEFLKTRPTELGVRHIQFEVKEIDVLTEEGFTKKEIYFTLDKDNIKIYFDNQAELLRYVKQSGKYTNNLEKIILILIEDPKYTFTNSL